MMRLEPSIALRIKAGRHVELLGCCGPQHFAKQLFAPPKLDCCGPQQLARRFLPRPDLKCCGPSPCQAVKLRLTAPPRLHFVLAGASDFSNVILEHDRHGLARSGCWADREQLSVVYLLA